jgi:hypothetical protein
MLGDAVTRIRRSEMQPTFAPTGHAGLVPDIVSDSPPAAVAVGVPLAAR